MGTASFVVRDPYTGAPAGRAPQHTPAEVEAMLARGHRAARGLGAADRAAVLERLAGEYAERVDEEAELITAETGLCIRQTRHEVSRVVEVFRAAAREALRLEREDWTAPFRADEAPGGPRLEVVADPVDLAAGITPFNHPLNQVAHKVGPALAAGAGIVIKPSEKTPLAALRLAEAVVRAGAPPHVVQVAVRSRPGAIVRQVVTSPRVEHVAFTGSAPVGKRIARMMARGGRELVRYVPELGGNCALAVLDDADLDWAARVALSAFDNSGQRCTSINRILVHASVADAFVERFVAAASRLVAGDPRDPAVDVGTVINQAAAVRIEGMVSAAVRDGARVLLGHRRRGALYAPTVLDHVPPHAAVATCEVFGPVASIVRVGSVQEAAQVAAGSPLRLAGAVMTGSQAAARAFADHVRVGQFSWNGPPSYRSESAPFGGFGDSGSGEKEGVVMATRGMLRLRTFYTHPSRA